jgi:hypothetical protein
MRTRKAELNRAPLIRLGQAILGYIDLFVRTICIILGLVVSGWVKFIDETPPAAASKHGIAAPQGNAAYSLSPLPITAAQPIYTVQPPLFR